MTLHFVGLYDLRRDLDPLNQQAVASATAGKDPVECGLESDWLNVQANANSSSSNVIRLTKIGDATLYCNIESLLGDRFSSQPDDLAVTTARLASGA
jgi:hypothetical protein